MKTFLSKLINWDTVKRVLWYAGAQAVVIFVASATDMISALEPSTTTVILGIILAQITKALNSK